MDTQRTRKRKCNQDADAVNLLKKERKMESERKKINETQYLSQQSKGIIYVIRRFNTCFFFYY